MPPDPLRRQPIVINRVAGQPITREDRIPNTVSSYCWVASVGEGVHISALLISRVPVTRHLQLAEGSLQAIRNAIHGARLVSPLGARYSHETTSIFRTSTTQSQSQSQSHGQHFLESCIGVPGGNAASHWAFTGHVPVPFCVTLPSIINAGRHFLERSRKHE